MQMTIEKLQQKVQAMCVDTLLYIYLCPYFVNAPKVRFLRRKSGSLAAYKV